jgi:LysR family transcriptional regulator, cys regulon transcriptional activator
MNLQQLRYAAEVARRGLNVSDAAAALHTSQPGVSKQLRALEEELGVEIFVRQGRRLTTVTDAGQEILRAVERILAEIATLRTIGEEYAHQAKGSLTVAVTHTQARYALPRVVTAFKKSFPEVRLKMLQGSPHQLARLVIDREADIAIATEALADYGELVSIPCYQWHHCVVVPAGHALAKAKSLTLEAIARFPLVTYDTSFTGRTAIDRAFAQRGLKPEIALTALDSDVIKSYVALGLGAGIVSSVAVGDSSVQGLVVLDASHLFPTQTTRIAFRRNAWLRGYEVEFVRLFVPHVTREALERLVGGVSEDFVI